MKIADGELNEQNQQYERRPPAAPAQDYAF
jgi:hypothetical protein